MQQNDPFKKIKSHFTSGLCTADSEWPVHLWDNLAEQAVVTINLLQTPLINASKSAYHQLHGRNYDWNTHTMAPPGSRGVIYEDPNSRSAWGTQGTDP